MSITVIALCYNHARFVIECLDSIAAQTHQDFQLVITDDASKDSSPRLIEDWIARHRPDATFIAHTVNRGICATLNEALRVSYGKYICMVATDDLWLPDKLERQLMHLRDVAPQASVVFGDALMVDEAGHSLGKSFIAEHRRPPSSDRIRSIFDALADGNFIPAPATLIRADALRAVGGYDETLTYEDYDMWLRLAAGGHEFSHLPAAIAKYRVVKTSMVNTIFIKPNAAHSRSLLKIHGRWLDSGRLNDAQRTQWRAKIAASAYNLFLLEDRDAARALRKAAWQCRNVRLGLLAIVSSLGIKRGWGLSWATRMRWRRAPDS